MPINQVLTKPDDPNIYLLVNGHEYRYNLDCEYFVQQFLWAQSTWAMIA